MEVNIVWFRNDLRVDDQPALGKALAANKPVLAVYHMNKQLLAPDRWGFSRMGPQRLQFLLDSLADLQTALNGMRVGLYLIEGDMLAGLAKLTEQFTITGIYYNKEVAIEETLQEAALDAWAAKNKIITNAFWYQTLYHPDDLPFTISKLPDIFTKFRKEVERTVKVRPLYKLPPKNVGNTTAIDNCNWPEWYAKLTHVKVRTRFKGGETAGKNRINWYFENETIALNYKQTRNDLLGDDYSTKFSPYLAFGCISARQIYAALRAFEQEVEANESTYWLFFELLWRDFFQFTAKKFGASLFKLGGIKKQPAIQKTFNYALFDAWRYGKTGIPFVDANMHELVKTGFMSNRGRQNVASFLVHDLKLDWRAGAAWFEHCLLDYDPASNYGNWNYVSGIGNDPRENRYFNVIKQAHQYDANAQYVKHWLKQLQKLPATFAHCPYNASQKILDDAGIKLNNDYPAPVILPPKW